MRGSGSGGRAAAGAQRLRRTGRQRMASVGGWGGPSMQDTMQKRRTSSSAASASGFEPLPGLQDWLCRPFPFTTHPPRCSARCVPSSISRPALPAGLLLPCFAPLSWLCSRSVARVGSRTLTILKNKLHACVHACNNRLRRLQCKLIAHRLAAGLPSASPLRRHAPAWLPLPSQGVGESRGSAPKWGWNRQ